LILGGAQYFQRDIFATLRIEGTPNLRLATDTQSFLQDVARLDERGRTRLCGVVHEHPPAPQRRSAARNLPAYKEFSHASPYNLSPRAIVMEGWLK